MTFTGNNSYFNGSLTFAGGKLILSGAGTLGSAGRPLTFNGGTLDLGGKTQTVGPINTSTAGAVGTLTNGSLGLNGNNAFFTSGTFDANLTGSGNSRLWIGGDATATVTLGGSNTIDYVDHHSTIIGHPTTGAAGTVKLTSNGALGPATVGVNLIEAQLFTGTLDLNGQSGVTVGNLLLASGSASKLVNTSTSAVGHLLGTVSVSAAGTEIGGAGGLDLHSSVSGAGGLNKTGAGLAVLEGNNFYSAATTITAGTLQVGNGGTTGTLGAGGVTLAGGNLVLYRGDVGTVTYANPVAGTGSLTLDGFNSAATPNVSDYRLTGSNGLGAGSVITIGGPHGGARLQRYAGESNGSATLVVAAGSTLYLNVLNNGNAVTLNGNGWNEAAGVLGALRLDAGATQSGAVTLATNSRIGTYNGATGTISGAVGGGGGLEKYGTGTLTLSGTNTYTGGTTVIQGTLRVTGNSSAATGAVTVAAGATLDGTGTVGGHVRVVGGTLRGGTGSAGTLTLGSGFDVSSGGTLAVRVAGGSPAAAGTGGSTNLSNPATNSYLHVTGGTTTIGPDTLVTVDLTGVSFQYQPYSYKIADGAGNQSGLALSASQITFTGGPTMQAATITGDALGGVYVNFTPVPEPVHVLLAATAVAGLAGFVRRRRTGLTC